MATVTPGPPMRSPLAWPSTRDPRTLPPRQRGYRAGCCRVGGWPRTGMTSAPASHCSWQSWARVDSSGRNLTTSALAAGHAVIEYEIDTPPIREGVLADGIAESDVVYWLASRCNPATAESHPDWARRRCRGIRRVPPSDRPTSADAQGRPREFWRDHLWKRRAPVRGGVALWHRRGSTAGRSRRPRQSSGPAASQERPPEYRIRTVPVSDQGQARGWLPSGWMTSSAGARPP